MIRIVTTDSKKAKDIPFDVITPLNLIDRVKRFHALAIDLKMTGLEALENKIEALTIATENSDIFVVMPDSITTEILADCFGHKTLIVHSGLSDISTLMAMGVPIFRVFDTCLCFQVCQSNVNKNDKKYDLKSTLDYFNIANSFEFYESGTFWKQGFSVGGCNYLSMYVRYLFDLKNELYKTYPMCTNLFSDINKSLIISAQMNSNTIEIDEALCKKLTLDTLEQITMTEGTLLNLFKMLNDSPGKLKDEVLFPDEGEAIIPIYDVNNEKEVEAFIERCDYDPDLFAAYDYGQIEELPSSEMFEEYQTLVNVYNDTLRRLSVLGSAYKKIGAPFVLSPHYTPISLKTLCITCVKNFPSPLLAKRLGVKPYLAGSIDPYDVLVNERLIKDDKFEYRLISTNNPTAFGLGVLANDRNMLAYAKDPSNFGTEFRAEIEKHGGQLRKIVSASSLVGSIIENNFLISKELSALYNMDNDTSMAVIKAISSIFSNSISVISGIEARLAQQGNAQLFGEYPLSWSNASFIQECRLKFTDEFWKDYSIHQEAKDDVYEKVQRYYSEVRMATKYVRKSILDYCHFYVMNKIMGSFLDEIYNASLTQLIQIVACDSDSFILKYPNPATQNVDEIENEANRVLALKFGETIELSSIIL